MGLTMMTTPEPRRFPPPWFILRPFDKRSENAAKRILNILDSADSAVLRRHVDTTAIRGLCEAISPHTGMEELRRLRNGFLDYLQDPEVDARTRMHAEPVLSAIDDIYAECFAAARIVLFG